MNKKKIFKGCLIVWLGATLFTFILGMLLYFINPEMFEEETSTTTVSEETSEEINNEITSNNLNTSGLTKEEILEIDKNVLNLKNNLFKIFEEVNQLVLNSKNNNKKGTDEDLKVLDVYGKDVFTLMGDLSIGTSDYATFLAVDIAHNINDIIKISRGILTTLDKKYLIQYDELYKKIEEEFSEVTPMRKQYFLDNGFTEEEIPAFE